MPQGGRGKNRAARAPCASSPCPSGLPTVHHLMDGTVACPPAIATSVKGNADRKVGEISLAENANHRGVRFLFPCLSVTYGHPPPNPVNRPAKVKSGTACAIT